MKKILPLIIAGILIISGFVAIGTTSHETVLDTMIDAGIHANEISYISDEIINMTPYGEGVGLEDKDSWPPSHYDVEFLPRVNMVNLNDSSDAEYNFFASIPMAVFHHNNRVYQSLLISDDASDTSTEYIIDDWKTYLEEWGGAQHINFIGDVSEYKKGEIMNKYGLEWDQISNITGGPIDVANQIALHDWEYSDYIVLAPYISSPTDEDIESISLLIVSL